MRTNQVCKLKALIEVLRWTRTEALGLRTFWEHVKILDMLHCHQ